MSASTNKACTLKRCQGRRGCICPKGNVPIGSYAGRKLDPIPSTPTASKISSQPIPSSKVVPTKKPTAKSKSPKKLEPISNPSPKVEASNESNTVANATSNIGTAEVDTVATTAAVSSSDAAVAVSSQDEFADFNGEVMIRYNHYKKKFPVKAGSLHASLIDEEYYLSFAFPNCIIHVTTYGPSDFSYEEQGLTSRPLMKEDPVGTYHGLDPCKEYWVHIEEDPAEKQAYEERQDQIVAENNAKRAAAAARGDDDDMIITTKTESCSCIEGNPCLDRYACKNWEKRYEVAKAHGWKGFQ